MERTSLAEAKRKFIASADAVDPSHFLRRHPLSSVGVAGLLGVAIGLSKATANNLSALWHMGLPLLQKILSSSLETSHKLDERQTEE